MEQIQGRWLMGYQSERGTIRFADVGVATLIHAF